MQCCNLPFETSRKRVRELIPKLSYLELARNKVIPLISEETPALTTKKYPPFLYTLSKTHKGIFADFGLFIEELVFQYCVEGKSFKTYETMTYEAMTYEAIWQKTSNIPCPDELKKENNFISGILKWAKSAFSIEFCSQISKIEHGVEIVHNTIEGHPDFILRTKETRIFDCKCTSKFETQKMGDQTYLQILAYCALERSIGNTCDKIGVLLPLQRTLMWYNVKGWDHSEFLNILLQEAKWSLRDNEYSEFTLKHNGVLYKNIEGNPSSVVTSEAVGSHMHKESAFDAKFFHDVKPRQIFLSNPRGNTLVPQKDLLAIAQNMTPNHKLFIHAPYTINLSTKVNDKWAIKLLKHELLAAQQIESKGVVVHVGKYKDQSVEDALNQMELSILEVLEVATDMCPLLIETPAGEGTELCVNIHEFQSFYARFNGDSRLKICVDTAHIWAAGYEPEFYISEWLHKFPNSIKLVHFNDSRKERGTRVDGHYTAGLGYIGYKKMKAVHDLCVAMDIPMVTE